jgi:glycosyltransferase involved in cell wall biosynthesis
MGLKVLMIGAYPLNPGMIVGGIESVTSTLLPALAAQDGIDHVTMLRFHSGRAPVRRRRESDKLDVIYLRGQNRLEALTRSILDVRQARRLVAELRPDIVHGQEIGWKGDIATQSSPNSVVTVHGLIHIETRLSQRGLRGKVRVRLMDDMVRRVLRRAKVLISISDYDSRALGGLVHGRQVHIPNPIGREFFGLAPSAPTGPRLLYAGVMTRRKNIEGLLNAFAIALRSVPAATLAVVGPHHDPAYAASVRAYARRLGLGGSVEFTGHVESGRLLAEIRQARAVVLFSREETAPTILAQAMAAGKPIVASRVGGIPEMVQNGENGWLVGSEDVAALAERMIAVLRDQPVALALGRRGHQIALERYEPTAVARRTVAAYEYVAGLGGGSGAPLLTREHGGL